MLRAENLEPRAEITRPPRKSTGALRVENVDLRARIEELRVENAQLKDISPTENLELHEEIVRLTEVMLDAEAELPRGA
jgi:hypothetical protein